MNYILFDDKCWSDLLPLTFTRPVADIRVGILKISEKWDFVIGTKFSFLTQNYLAEKFVLKSEADNILINGSVLPEEDLVNAISALKNNEVLVANEKCIAARVAQNKVAGFNGENISELSKVQFAGNVISIENPWDIFSMNGRALELDFKLLTNGRNSAPLSDTNKILGNNIFVEEGVKAECCVFNTLSGPIYLGKDSEVMEGSVIRGPFSLGEHSALKLSTKIYGPTTVGPYSKVGGEINNSVIFGYSNKAHDGFLGNSVLGEWCNIGADSNNSNLKNNYEKVKLWNYNKKRFVSTGLQFCGLIMGDHSKCGINTMFNTGTVVGVSSNIFGEGFPRNYIPSFSWGGAKGFTDYKLDKAVETARLVFERREKEFDAAEFNIFKYLYEEALQEKIN